MVSVHPSLSIVIPCYNEAKNIPLIVKRFQEVLLPDYSCEIILVNNGSTDNSAEVLKQELASAGDDRFRVVTVAKNKGYGHGIRSGLAKARGQVLAWTHADMQTDPADIFRAHEKFLGTAGPRVFVTGERKKRAIVPLIFTVGMGLLASLLLKTSLREIGAQPKLFSREFYEQYLKEGAPDDFSLDLYAQYWATRKGKVVYIPVYFANRMHGEAKGGGSFKTRMKLTLRVIQFTLRMRKDLKAKGLL